MFDVRLMLLEHGRKRKCADHVKGRKGDLTLWSQDLSDAFPRAAP